MERRTFFSVVLIYFALLIGTGYLAFFQAAPSGAKGIILDNPTVLDQVKNDQELKEDVLADVRRSRAEEEKISDLSTHSFDVVLGALIGFLSASSLDRRS